eukprot:6945566-Alexandrium_andersonii.AAC.1
MPPHSWRGVSRSASHASSKDSSRATTMSSMRVPTDNLFAVMMEATVIANLRFMEPPATKVYTVAWSVTSSGSCKDLSIAQQRPNGNQSPT